MIPISETGFVVVSKGCSKLTLLLHVKLGFSLTAARSRTNGVRLMEVGTLIELAALLTVGVVLGALVVRLYERQDVLMALTSGQMIVPSFPKQCRTL